ncbi:hypothetical protein Pmani_001386 [Petrolisthes manimaculis]|uniref:2-aminoethanethiol dioxygenase n=1 Tax=Petrolisthes manimaculis TaxID=1843537 RepID=A0AAE1QJK9_9EUCA|nr:hypothetical protein Pmani_018607 [Petrolisthes manimaculis]KAK4328179.1 hypothetical protein Pmani_001386 [Petrolisthes manimaculis]
MQKLARQAVKTFCRDPKLSAENFQSSYDKLCGLLDTLTPQDLNLNPRLLHDRGHYNASRDGAPVTYMQIYEDQDVTVCVFILKHGVRLPLHDHPNMFGLLKVVHGVVGVQSYSLGETSFDVGVGGMVPATKHTKVEVRAGDAACRLCPGDHNIHEIHSIDGPAAFLDILSPPYGEDMRTGHDRDCHYYQELSPSLAPSLAPSLSTSASPNSTWLLSVPTPADFWCDQVDYQGPTITSDPDPRIS